jgi:hypothetical protein
MRIEWDLEARWNKQKPFLLFAVFVDFTARSTQIGKQHRRINPDRNTTAGSTQTGIPPQDQPRQEHHRRINPDRNTTAGSTQTGTPPH